MRGPIVLAFVASLLLTVLPAPVPSPAGQSAANHQLVVVGGPCALGEWNRVAIVDNAFVPAGIVIARGDPVLWLHGGQNDHTTTSDDGLWDSGIMQGGDHFAVQFCLPGRFLYHCEVHGFQGSVVVY